MRWPTTRSPAAFPWRAPFCGSTRVGSATCWFTARRTAAVITAGLQQVDTHERPRGRIVHALDGADRAGEIQLRDRAPCPELHHLGQLGLLAGHRYPVGRPVARDERTVRV